MSSAELEDYWAILSLEPGASKQDVQRAYRKKTLAVHPDRYKGSDPEWANAEFLRLTRAKEVLEDDKARAAFEALRAARAKHRERQEAQSAGRKKLREDLEAREEAARKRARSDPTAAEQAQAQAHAEAQQEASARAELQRELERLRRTGRLGGNAGANSHVGATDTSTTTNSSEGGTAGTFTCQMGAASTSEPMAVKHGVTMTLRWAPEKPFLTESLRSLLVDLGAPEEGLIMAIVGAKAVVELPSAAVAKTIAERSDELAARGIRMAVSTRQHLQPPGDASAAGGRGAVPFHSGQTALPAGWKAQTTADGKTYYYHIATRQTQWTLPACSVTGSGKESGTGPAAALAGAHSVHSHEDLESVTLMRLRQASERQKLAQ